MNNETKNHNYFDSIKQGYHVAHQDSLEGTDKYVNGCSELDKLPSQTNFKQTKHIPNELEGNERGAEVKDESGEEVGHTMCISESNVLGGSYAFNISNFSSDVKMNSFKSDLSKSTVIVNHLFTSSEVFLKKAHKSVLMANSIEGSKKYYKLIKLSIKALLILTKRYAQFLNPELKLIAYFKLAKIYFSETENLNKADDYINKAINVSSRNNLINLKFMSEVLAAQILEKTNPNLLLNYLNEKINNYKNLKLNNYANLFQFLKVSNSLLLNYSSGLIVLQSVTQDPDIDQITKALFMLHQCNMHLYRGSPNEASNLLEQISFQIFNSGVEFPVQVRAMFYLLSLLKNIQINNIDACERCTKDVNLLINSEQKNKWRSWGEDGKFRINIPMGSEYSKLGFSYQVSWLSSDDFVIMFYFLLGMSLLEQAHNGKRKAKKVFDRCLQIIEKQIQELTTKVQSSRNFPLNQLNNKLIKLHYMKYNINYYQVWMNFLTNNFSDISPLNEFMSRYNKNSFNSEELCYYRLLLPKLFYVFGLYYHNAGDMAASKFYFMKVRNFSSSFKRQNDKKISVLQLSLGLGSESICAENEFSELYVFASLHLIIINEFEVRKISHLNRNQNKEILNELHKFGTCLYEDLAKVFEGSNKVSSNTFSTNFTISNELIQITYQILLLIFDEFELKLNGNGGSDKLQVKIQELVRIIEQKKVTNNHPFINNLILLIIYQYVRDLNKRNEYFQRCFALISDTNGSDSGKVLQMYILQLFEKNMKATGNEDKAQMIELQIKVLKNSINKKSELSNFYFNSITNDSL